MANFLEPMNVCECQQTQFQMKHPAIHYIFSLNFPRYIKIILLFITTVTLIIANFQIQKLNLESNNVAHINESWPQEHCLTKPISGPLDLGAFICKLSNDSAPYLVLKLENAELHKFNANEFNKLIQWLKGCEINSIQRPRCALTAVEGAECWYQSRFGGGTSMCFDHNYSFEYLTIGGFRLYGESSKNLISFLMSNAHV